MNSKLLRATLGLLTAAILLVGAPAASASFGITSFKAALENQNGSLDTQAGSHPYEAITDFTLKTVKEEGLEFPDKNVREVVTDLPAGFIGNPTAMPTCPRADLGAYAGCPVSSQVGVVFLRVDISGTPETFTEAVFNVVPNKGDVADFGFAVLGVPVHIAITVRDQSDYGVRATLTNISEAIPIIGTELVLWGVPAEASHNEQRGTGFQCFGETCFGGGDASGAPAVPFLTDPTECAKPLTTTVTVRSWQNSQTYSSASYTTPTALSGCERLSFEPSLSVRPDTTEVGSPTGLEVNLSVPQREAPEGLATPTLRNAVVTLPQGMSISPSLANGLGSCSDEQLGIGTSDAAVCPENSKIGEVTIHTPLLAEPLTGSLYVGQPQPGNLYRVFLVAENPEYGFSVRLRGTVSPDPVTGQLTATFAETPQLPFSDLTLRFKGGAQAPLSNPSLCGPATTTSRLQPWSAPADADASPRSAFQLSADGAGGACPATQPFAPTFVAGTVNPQAGAFSPFSMTLSRGDSEQDLGAIALHAPPGLLGVLKSVALCPEPAAAEGACPASSLIGHTTVAAGAGPAPFWLGGQVFLTGPYKGAPFGLSIVVPAIAGPFDLGTVVVRARIDVDPHTAALTITSDPLPTILQGTPLQLRTVNVTVDRAGFMLNPTNCSRTAVDATVSGAQGASAGVGSPFQAANCAVLPFKPKFTVSTQANAGKAGGASLDVKIASGPGQANIGKVKVDLPKQLPSRLATLHMACTASVFEADPANCPAASNVGTGTAVTPILAHPLTGPAFLVSHGGAAFPDLEIVLQGEGITLILDGQTQIKDGITSNTFRSVPDAPISSFELKLPTGPHSVLAANLPVSARFSFCGQALVMPTAITGQNGAVIDQDTKIAVTGCPTHKQRKAKASHAGQANDRHGKGRK
jgi:hypothetical protein